MADLHRYCADCGKEFAATEAVFILSHKIKSDFCGLPVTVSQNLPVCEDCLSADQRKAWKRPGEFGRRIVPYGKCRACRRPLMAYAEPFWRGEHCSNACAQIARRRQQREPPPSVTCSVCSKQFQPTRSDAQFCSSACRQWAYRRRLNS